MRRAGPEGVRLIRFGRFELDLDQEELRKNGRPVRLQDQPFRLLRLLVLSAGRVVRREEIREALWERDTWVDFEQGINHAIRHLRAVLGDEADAPRFIETLPRKGYRFIAATAEIEVAPGPKGGDATEGFGRPRIVAMPGRTAASVSGSGAPAADDSMPRGRAPEPERRDIPSDRHVDGRSTPAGTADGGLAPDEPAPVGSDRARARSNAPAREAGRRRMPRRQVSVLTALVTLALLIASGILAAAIAGYLGPAPDAVDPEGSRPLLAVLPFANLTGSPDNDYLAEGLTEELITQLGRRFARRLGVIARTSVLHYAGSPPPAKVIGRELGADFILEGSIRRDGGRLRVTAQLVRTGDQSHVWATHYDRTLGDLIEIQSEVSRRISDALALQLLDPEGRDEVRAAAKPESYEGYLRARHLLNRGGRGDAQAALAELEIVVKADPGFARGWSALALAWRAQGLRRDEAQSRAREAVLKALSLDDSLEEAWLILAMIRFYGDLDPEGARLAFERAIESHPGYANAHHQMAAYWSIRGEHDKAIASVRRALALDPLSPAVNADVGWYYYFARRYDEAVEASRRTLEISPGYLWAWRSLILASLARGDRSGALEACRAEMRMNEVPPQVIARLDNPDPDAALREYWMWDLRRWELWSRRERAQPAVVGLIYATLGYREAALFTLERAFEARSGWETPFLRVHPQVDPLREEPGFRALMDRLETVAATHAAL